MAKKDFQGNMPALGFISEQQGTVAPPAGYRTNYAFIETKSRRVQLLMQPSLHAKLKEAAAAHGLSFNDYVHKTLEQAIAEGR